MAVGITQGLRNKDNRMGLNSMEEKRQMKFMKELVWPKDTKRFISTSI